MAKVLAHVRDNHLHHKHMVLGVCVALLIMLVIPFSIMPSTMFLESDTEIDSMFCVRTDGLPDTGDDESGEDGIWFAKELSVNDSSLVAGYRYSLYDGSGKLLSMGIADDKHVKFPSVNLDDKDSYCVCDDESNALVSFNVTDQMMVDSQYERGMVVGDEACQMFGAQWRDDDGILHMGVYNRLDIPATGSTINGHVLMNVRPMSDWYWSNPYGYTWDLQYAEVEDIVRPTNMAWWFYKTGVKVIDVSRVDASYCTTMQETFSNCYYLEQLDVSRFNTPALVDMRSTFCECKILTELDLSEWDTSNVTNMTYAFSTLTHIEILDISTFSFASCTDAAYMFVCDHELRTIYASESIPMATCGTNNIFDSDTNLVGGNGSTYYQTQVPCIDTSETPGLFTYKAKPELRY